ncbi:MAG: choice-of-anchor D domain-containing protein, partial [Pseudomonadota bacterium]
NSINWKPHNGKSPIVSYPARGQATRDLRFAVKITDTLDFGDAVAGTTIQKDVVVTNTGTTALTTGHIDTSTINTPFSLVSNQCENIPLAAGANCRITVQFSPPTADYFVSSFTVEIASYGYTFPVTLRTPASEASVNPLSISFGAQPVFDPEKSLPPKQQVIRLTNKGDRDLHLTSITFSGANADEFEIFDNCTTSNNVNGANLVPVGSFCIMVVNFKPNDLLEKLADIRIISDDPAHPDLTINIAGGATDDDDGIPRSEEDAVSNNGDGNNDGLPDGLQNNVVSFKNISNEYSTLIADTAVSFTKIKKLSATDFATLPDNVNFSNGIVSYELIGINSGSTALVGLVLPETQQQKDIYIYGPSATNTQAHWIKLGTTGIPSAILLGTNNLGTNANNKISRNLSQIILIDGGDGDNDGIANGVIVITSAADISPASTDGGGSLSIYLLSFMTVFYLIRRRRVNQY